MLHANVAAGVKPNPVQDEKEGQQVEEQSDSLKKETHGEGKENSSQSKQRMVDTTKMQYPG